MVIEKSWMKSILISQKYSERRLNSYFETYRFLNVSLKVNRHNIYVWPKLRGIISNLG